MPSENESSEELLKLAQGLFRTRNYSEALKGFEEVLKSDPDNIKAWRGAAASNYELNHFEAAIEQFQKVAKLDYQSGTAWLNLGAIYLKLERYQEAIDAVRKGMMREKRSAIGFFYLGEAHSGLGQTKMAMSGYKEALSIDDKLFDAHLGLANLHLEMKNHRMAEQHFSRALELQPGSKRAQEGLHKTRVDADHQRDSVSPFGRLVDEDNIGLKARISLNRSLSVEEQIEDRTAVHTITAEIQTAAEECLRHLTQEIEQAVLKLNRALAEGDSTPRNVLAAFDHFHGSVKEWIKLRDEMRKKMLKLRAHEEFVNTPDFDGF